MAKRKQAVGIVDAIRKLALRYPEVLEEPACCRTAFRARKKSFLFMGATQSSCDALVKLGQSLEEARTLAAKEPARYKVGSAGWVTVTLGTDDVPPAGLLERWIDESFRLVAPRQLVAGLPAPCAKTVGANRR